MDRSKEHVFGWVDRRMGDLSDWNQVIWHFGETALREYRSAAWYVDRLKQEGFEVEAGTGGMPTAFRATWSNGTGPAHRGLCRVRRRAGQLPGGRHQEDAARRVVASCRRAHRSAFRARHLRTRRRVGGQGGDERTRPQRHYRIVRRAGGEAAPVEAGPCREGLLRQARRRDQLPPDLHAAAGEHSALGHPLRRWLCLHLHLRMPGAGKLAERRSGFADPGQPRLGARAGRDRCAVPHVRAYQADAVEHAALHARLVAERGDPDGGAGDRRQPAGAGRADPVSVAHADHRDGGAGGARARQQRRGGGQGRALHLDAHLGHQVASRPAQPSAGGGDLSQHRAGGRAEMGRARRSPSRRRSRRSWA